MSTIFRLAGLFSTGGTQMTEIEELVKLILPELIMFLKNEENSTKEQKELDIILNPSIPCVQEAPSHD